MRFNVDINQQKCLEYKLTLSEGGLMDLLNQLSSWADEMIIEGEVYYHLSRNKVIEEIPLFYQKPDTVYRAFKSLANKKLVDYRNHNRKDYMRLSVVGKQWNKLGNKSEFRSNSEINPRKLGNKSENDKMTNQQNQGLRDANSDLNPTYNIISTTSNKREMLALGFLLSESPSLYENFLMNYKSKIKNFQKFCSHFNSKFDEEELKYTSKIIRSRLNRFADNWIERERKDFQKEKVTDVTLTYRKKVS
ncbi:hypothetical protein [Aquimarina sp. 2201CG14-23]|uniref:hypothetical protein n=1 Tax=Aquimarina mycalae TaxID=3040073 RepID=UPI00247828E0|nr:hypothetical protein [Aquimarina sp. 2201CG14-23]MDH7444659.1 hypothetical protein [Aquimarina sp. 2201CG14-23]